MTVLTADVSMAERARLSGGHSQDAIYAAVARALPPTPGRLVDVGSGGGALWAYVRGRFTGYIGIDGVAFDGFPSDGRLVLADLDTAVPLATGSADAVVSVETIEHLENPRAFVRELVRIARPGAPVVITTPNQLSALSLLTLLTRRQFGSFQDVHYPAHRTALLEVDLRRIARETGLSDLTIQYTCAGRIVFTARHYPRWLARLAPRLFSDNVLLVARKPAQ
ncbi:MAG TPA: methyltransferase domain-containing protein [Vicinamibacterales bacterium]